MNQNIGKDGNPPENGFVYRLDTLFRKTHEFLFLRHGAVSFSFFSAVYLSAIFLYGKKLGVAANYFVLGPMISAALAYGLPGGFFSGLLAQPANLALFYLMGNPGASPENPVITEIAGLLLGITLGYLSDFFRRIEGEILRRKMVEVKLLQSVYVKDALLEELHHRVKNNLNVIKSIIRLQMNRSSNPDFIAEAGNIVRRIYSFSLVYDQLYRIDDLSVIKADTYISELVGNIITGGSDPANSIRVSFMLDPVRIPVSQASLLGLIVNEVVMNAVKHAYGGVESPELEVAYRRDGDTHTMVIRDNGVGMHATGKKEALGLVIVGTLVSQLGGSCTFRDENGTVFELAFTVSQ